MTTPGEVRDRVARTAVRVLAWCVRRAARVWPSVDPHQYQCVRRDLGGRWQLRCFPQFVSAPQRWEPASVQPNLRTRCHGIDGRVRQGEWPDAWNVLAEECWPMPVSADEGE